MDVLVHLQCNLSLVRYLDVQGSDSLGGAILVFSEFGTVLLIKVLDGILVVEGVHGGVVCDVLDPLFLSELQKLASSSGVSEIFSGSGEKELVLEVLEGLYEDRVDGGGDEGFHLGDGVGRDKAIYHLIMGEVALV